jgi:hypothetical protein
MMKYNSGKLKNITNHHQKIDVSNKVMQDVVGFETKQIKRWKGAFYIVLSLLVIISLFTLYFIYHILKLQGTFDLLELFSEDKEIIAEFWQDTIMVFWEELPYKAVLLVFISILFIIGLIVGTRRRRKILKRKEDVLKKFKINSTKEEI